MNKGTKYGKSKDEEAWKSTEVDMIYRLHAAGVRVPMPHTFIDGVLVMQLVIDGEGNPAPRLGELEFSPKEATEIFQILIREVQLMLCAGVVHGDLSEFNVLLSEDGPVVIDFPQAVNAAGNLNARSLLRRDVGNLQRFLARWAPETRRQPYAEELWELYESNQLERDTKLTGRVKRSSAPVDTSEVLSLIADANRDEAERRQRAGQATLGVESEAARPLARRREVIVSKPPQRTGPRNSDLRRGGDAQRARRDAQRGSGPRLSGGDARYGGSDARRAGGNAQHDSRRGPGRPPGAKSPPKRGDAAPVSTYVSPEARRNKANILKLTPRDNGSHPANAGPAPKQHGARARHGGGPSAEPSAQRAPGAPSGGGTNRRRRTRRRSRN
jgi:RIO kinase 1